VSLAPFFLAGYALAVAISTVVAAYALRKWSEPGAPSFAALLLLVAAWASACTVGLLTADHEWRLFWEKTQMTAAVLAPIAWFVFVLGYTGYGSSLTKRRLGALLLLPVGGVALLWVDPFPLAWQGVSFVRAHGLLLVDQHTGVYMWAVNFYAAVLVLAGTGLLLQFTLTAGHLYRDQTIAIGIGAGVPILVSFLSALDVTPIQGLNVTPLGFVLSGVAFGNALSRYDFFERIPAAHRLGRRAITENMRDGVVIVDDRDRIVETNDVAATALEVDPATAVEQRVGDVFPDALVDGTAIDGELEVDRVDGHRVFDVRESPITDQHGRRVGRVIVLRDVTERKNREQRLSVLTRVLRHNLRNEMNLVDGYASDLGEELDGDLGERARTIESVATDLVELSEKARDVERILARTSTDSTRADFATIVGETVSEITDRYPDVDISTDLADGLEVPKTRSRAIVENLLENAAEHNDATDPRVEVTVEPVDDGDAARLVVADNGSGIPPDERRALEKEAETPLEHGSGLGLWVVTWSVRSLGGTIAFETSSEGTEVRIRLPIA
jgi:signal transduction histidine kinase